jgi:flagellin
MGMVVRTNMPAIGANNALSQAQKAQQSGMQKLYTGLKINSAKDDASGLAISEKMKNQIKALDTAKDNCEDGANMIQTAEGYMKETHDILTRMTELAEKSANGVLKDEDRDSLQKEMDQLCAEIDRVASTANFNGVKLLDGSLGSKEKVTVTCTPEDGFKVEAPKNQPGTELGGCKVEGPDTAINGRSYKVSAAPTAITSNAEGSNLNQVTVKAKLMDKLESDAITGAADEEFTFNVKAGDKVTFDDQGEGISTNGLKFEGATKALGETFTFDGDKWVNEEGKTLSSDYGAVKMSLDESVVDADTVFEYKRASDNGINLQIGDSSTTADRLTVNINSFHTDALFGGLQGLVNVSNDNTDREATAAVKINSSNPESTYKNAVSIDITDKDAASAAADAIRQIANYVSDERGKLGAQQNRLDHTVNNLATASENTTASKSRILDTDMAKEMMEYTSKNVIAQAAQSMLAQANSQPQNVLSLLQ